MNKFSKSEELQYRDDIDKINRQMFCPFIKDKCITTKCMIYDDMSQNCSILFISKGFELKHED